MTDIFIFAGVSLASAAVGAGLTWSMYAPDVRSLRSKVTAWMNVYHEAVELTCVLSVRIDDALANVPPYKRGVNGTVQKIGRILRGDQ